VSVSTSYRAAARVTLEAIDKTLVVESYASLNNIVVEVDVNKLVPVLSAVIE
jgi:hypothetical protein